MTLARICKRSFSTTLKAFTFNQPPTARDMLRAGGIASMFRLPIYKDTKGNQHGFVSEYFNILLLSVLKIVFFFISAKILLLLMKC